MDRDRRTRPRSVKKKIWKHGAILSWQDRLGIAWKLTIQTIKIP